MNQKKKIVEMLNEMDDKKHVVMSSDKYKDMGSELDDDTIVKIVDEDFEDFEKSSREVQYGINPNSQVGDIDNKIDDRIINIVNELKKNSIDITVDNIVIGSLFSAGGTLAGNEDDIEYLLSTKFNGVSENGRPKLKKKDINHEPTDSRGIDPMHPNRRKMKKKDINHEPTDSRGIDPMYPNRRKMKVKDINNESTKVKNTRPRMKKSDLVEHVLKTNK